MPKQLMFLSILVIAKAVIQRCRLYSAFLICDIPQRCCQVDLSNDLVKMLLTPVTLLSWEGCVRARVQRSPLYHSPFPGHTYRELQGCPGGSDTAAATPAMGMVISLGDPGGLSAPLHE